MNLALVERARVTGAGFWRGRTARERQLITAAAVLLGGYVLFAWVWQPLLTARSEAVMSISRFDAALARLEAAPAETSPAIRDGAESVTSILTTTAPDRGIAISRIEPEDGGARLSVDNVDFAELLRWIETLETDYGLRVTAAEMSRRPEPGAVRATLMVTR